MTITICNFPQDTPPPAPPVLLLSLLFLSSCAVVVNCVCLRQGPVLVRGLGRFLELKDMARQAAEVKAAVEAKVFITQPKQPTAPFTTPQPFRLGPEVPLGYEARRRRAQVGGIGGCLG